MADIDSFVAHGAPPPSAATELREEEHGQQRTAMADLEASLRALRAFIASLQADAEVRWCQCASAASVSPQALSFASGDVELAHNRSSGRK